MDTQPFHVKSILNTGLNYAIINADEYAAIFIIKMIDLNERITDIEDFDFGGCTGLERIVCRTSMNYLENGKLKVR